MALSGRPKVQKKQHSWGQMMHVQHGSSRSYPLHPEHQEAIAKLKDGESTEFVDEQNKRVKAEREGGKVHLSARGAKEKTTIEHSEFAPADSGGSGGTVSSRPEKPKPLSENPLVKLGAAKRKMLIAEAKPGESPDDAIARVRAEQKGGPGGARTRQQESLDAYKEIHKNVDKESMHPEVRKHYEASKDAYIRREEADIRGDSEAREKADAEYRESQKREQEAMDKHGGNKRATAAEGKGPSTVGGKYRAITERAEARKKTGFSAEHAEQLAKADDLEDAGQKRKAGDIRAKVYEEARPEHEKLAMKRDEAQHAMRLAMHRSNSNTDASKQAALTAAANRAVGKWQAAHKAAHDAKKAFIAQQKEAKPAPGADAAALAKQRKLGALVKRESKQHGPLQTGARGGQYYESESGQKVYVGKGK